MTDVDPLLERIDQVLAENDEPGPAPFVMPVDRGSSTVEYVGFDYAPAARARLCSRCQTWHAADEGCEMRVGYSADPPEPRPEQMRGWLAGWFERFNRGRR